MSIVEEYGTFKTLLERMHAVAVFITLMSRFKLRKSATLFCFGLYFQKGIFQITMWYDLTLCWGHEVSYLICQRGTHEF